MSPESTMSSTSFVAVLFAAALLLPGDAAQAQTPSDPRNQCGALSSGAATCSDQAYTNGIRYDVWNGWNDGVAGDVALTVTGGPDTTITAPPSPANGWTDDAIVVRTATQTDSTSRDIVLNVGAGANDGNAVTIVGAPPQPARASSSCRWAMPTTAPR